MAYQFITSGRCLPPSSLRFLYDSRQLTVFLCKLYDYEANYLEETS